MAICLVLAKTADERLRTFASAEALWNDAIRLVERRRLPDVRAERAYNNRGVIRAERQDYAQAIADFERALAYNPDYYPAYFSRAQTLAALGSYDAALADLDRAQAIRPGYANTRLSRAAVLGKLGRDDEAAAELKHVCDDGNVFACWVLQRRVPAPGGGKKGGPAMQPIAPLRSSPAL